MPALRGRTNTSAPPPSAATIAAAVAAAQTVVSRETSPLGSGVLSITMLRAGDAYNVIPDEVMFGGTIR